MARDRADHRRLNLAVAVMTALRGVPAQWAGSWAVLVFLSLMIAAPMVVPLDGGLGLAWAMVAGLSALSAWAALTRIAVGGGLAGGQRLGLGAGGLQFGGAELRIAWGLCLNMLFLSMIGVVLALVVLAVAGMAELNVAAIQARDWAGVGPTWKLAVVGIVGSIGVGVPLLLITRLSLFAPASVGRRRTVSLDSMGIATGAFWALLCLWLIVGAFGALGIAAFRLSPLLGAVVLPWLWAPLAVGLPSAAYRQLEYWTPNSPDGAKTPD